MPMSGAFMAASRMDFDIIFCDSVWPRRAIASSCTISRVTASFAPVTSGRISKSTEPAQSG